MFTEIVGGITVRTFAWWQDCTTQEAKARIVAQAEDRIWHCVRGDITHKELAALVSKKTGIEVGVARDWVDYYVAREAFEDTPGYEDGFPIFRDWKRQRELSRSTRTAA